MLQLDTIELRVLGVLMEKALTTPAAYPLTLNAIVQGANQKQNREPVMALTEGAIAAAVHQLERRQLVAQAPPSPGARANRFQHCVVDRLHWDRREQAIMAELMLRGRQTGGELRTHAARMANFPDMAGVMATLQGLMSSEPPYVEELPREPGRSANRFRHLLAEDEAGATAASAGSAGETESAAPDAPSAAADLSLVKRVERLEAQVTRLSSELAALRKNQAPSIDVPGESKL